MKNRLIIFGSLSMILISGYINLKVLKSFVEQSYLLYDFNSFQLSFPIEQIESYNDFLPNISVSGLPLKMMKARYFMRDSLIDKALSLFHQSSKANPYIRIADLELAKYHYKKDNIDSAEIYSKKAFKALPRQYLFSRLYFQTLTKQKKDKELDKAFQEIKGYYIIDQWRDYMLSKIRINQTPKEEILKIIKEAKNYSSYKNQFSTLESVLEIGFENLGDLGKIIFEAESAYKQDRFTEAANLYESAARMNDSDYTHFENAALSFYRGNDFEQAEKLFRYVLNTFNLKNGKSEFYLGLLLYEKKQIKEACGFWDFAINKGYPGALKVKKSFCK